MELRQIQYFIEVAKREHVTEAATHLHIAQSAVSRQIFNLESELGVDLFIREGRNVKLTTIGRIFLQHVEEAVTILDNARREVKEYLDPGHGTIRIGFPSSLATCDDVGHEDHFADTDGDVHGSGTAPSARATQ